MNLSIAGDRPDEAAPLQAFGEESQTISISPQDFNRVPPSATEDEQMPGERVILQDVLNF